ncbi:hypothetical protein V496_09860 [Pseudogymnoascus sp. VKM F-4515 (FW-2607)]|nr:hypothetical protein V496_09860 [Pseudogymnoascus sp. VKM F-4515 (FW-2607)]KFY93721.1 hypothetical protein V498_04290 [Pseudogymnoascus sp. VKM F-4517 (FW-2822)]
MIDLKEESAVKHIESRLVEPTYPPEILALYEKFDDDRKKKLLRKMDFHLIPIITLLYLFAYLDRGNIGNAKLAGLLDGVHINDAQYNICLTVFFVTYVIFEVPANMLLKKFKPSVWIPTITVAWGIVMVCHGFVHNYAGLLACRLVLGIPEAGIFPACSYYVTMWYPRAEAQYRTALFYGAASLAGAFSGLLAYCISLMDGVGGYGGWQWIFILEGAATVVGGLVAWFFIHDSPNEAKWLDQEEADYINAQLAYDGNSSGNALQEGRKKTSYIKEAFCDWQIYLSSMIYIGISTSTYGLVFGLPTIIKNLGYSARIAQLLTVPPYATACILTIVVAHFSDKYKKRGVFVVSSLTTAAIGFTLAIATSDRPDLSGITYAGCFIACCGFYPAFPGIIAWLANNLAGSYKRAVGMGLQISLGNTGGLIGSNIFRDKDAPAYRLGYGISIGFIVMSAGAATLMIIILDRINKKRAALVDEMGGEAVVVEEQGEWNLTEMGDRSPLFRYIL